MKDTLEEVKTMKPRKANEALQIDRRTMLQTVAAATALSWLAPLPAKASEKTGRVQGAFHPVSCEGFYPGHLQGICTDQRDSIYWSFTEALVQTDVDGKVRKQVPVAWHHGDLCYRDGRVYVAVNLGKFNQPPGKANSWVYVYDADTLEELARHPVPEAVHGAGGIACDKKRFIVVGGLPPGIDDNYLYEYDLSFSFQKRHVFKSGYTVKGIQTATYFRDRWWFGCYGKPQVLLIADQSFNFLGRYVVSCSVGIDGLPDGRFLLGRTREEQGKGWTGQTVLAAAHDKHGLTILKP
jgi:hypothetical protein